MYISIYVYLSIYMYLCINICVYMYIYLYIYIYINIYIYTAAPVYERYANQNDRVYEGHFIRFKKHLSETLRFTNAIRNSQIWDTKELLR